MNSVFPVWEAVRRASLDAGGSAKAIADFLLLEGAGVASLSMAQVAGATYTSKPSLVRFAKRLGYAGWPEFREVFLTEAIGRAEVEAKGGGVDVNHPFAMGDSLADAFGNVVRVGELAAAKVAERLDEEVLSRVVDAIDGSSVLAFFARPPGRYLGCEFAWRLNSIGRACLVPHAEESDLVISLMGPGDCAIFASYGGNLAKEPLSYVEDVRGRGVTVVAITSDNSALAQAADIALAFQPQERYYDKVSGFYSCSCMRNWLDALFVACYLRRYDDYRRDSVLRAERLERLTGVADDLLDT